ncbi:MAG: hypothetical protein RL185_415 [Bacteroidota bacterium]
MIDPISIGIAFTAAQQAVGSIKKAMSLGKDVNDLYKHFGRFFESSDVVHSANTQIKAGELTDGEIKSQSLQIAMQSKKLRDAESDLKNLLIWSGNRDVWDQMMAERVRLYKERAAVKKQLEEAKARAKMEMWDRFFIFLAFCALGVPAFLISLNLLLK